MTATLNPTVNLSGEQGINNGEMEDKYQEQYMAFIAMTAHDLQAPLRKLGVLTDRLTQKITQDDDIRQYTTRMHACIHEMQGLIGGLTELASTTTEQMNVESCNLEEIALKSWHELAGMVKEKQAKLETRSLPVIRADRTQLRTLFRELMKNSLVFARNGEPVHVEISGASAEEADLRTAELPAERNYTKIVYCDNGIGFEAEQAKKIFDPLVRLHGKSGYPGFGLGLSLAKKIVQLHGGNIYTEDTKGDGAKFIIILPNHPHS